MDFQKLAWCYGLKDQGSSIKNCIIGLILIQIFLSIKSTIFTEKDEASKKQWSYLTLTKTFLWKKSKAFYVE